LKQRLNVIAGKEGHLFSGRDCMMEAYCEREMNKNEKVIELLNELRKKEFTGFIRINYSQGGITRIEKNEEILKKAQSQR
jgi:hypothetical protein